MTGEPVSREEFHMLRAAVADNAGRIDRTAAVANATGSGIAVLGAQLAEVIKDVGTVTADLETFRRDHLAEHQAERASRANGRRWAVGVAIAAAAAVASLWAPLLYIAGHIR